MFENFNPLVYTISPDLIYYNRYHQQEMVPVKRDNFKSGFVAGSAATGIGTLLLVGLLGALGYAAYLDSLHRLKECQEKVEGLEKKVLEPKDNPAPVFPWPYAPLRY